MRVQKFDSNGIYVGQVGIPGQSDGRLFLPLMITVDSSDNIYVSDLFNRVQIFDSNGTFLRKVGVYDDSIPGAPGIDPGQFNVPTGIAVTASRIFVADTNNDRIQLFAQDLMAPTISLNSPAEGSVFVLNQTVNADYTCQDEQGGTGLAS